MWLWMALTERDHHHSDWGKMWSSAWGSSAWSLSVFGLEQSEQRSPGASPVS